MREPHGRQNKNGGVPLWIQGLVRRRGNDQADDGGGGATSEQDDGRSGAICAGASESYDNFVVEYDPPTAVAEWNRPGRQRTACRRVGASEPRTTRPPLATRRCGASRMSSNGEGRR